MRTLSMWSSWKQGLHSNRLGDALVGLVPSVVYRIVAPAMVVLIVTFVGAV